MAWSGFTREEFVRHVRNMALLGLVLYISGILTGYVTNWVCLMLGLCALTLFFTDFFYGRTKGAAYFWFFVFIYGMGNYKPFRFPLNAEAWKLQTNDIIDWIVGGKGTMLFPGRTG